MRGILDKDFHESPFDEGTIAKSADIPFLSNLTVPTPQKILLYIYSLRLPAIFSSLFVL
jgi:hypothetical protein